MSTLKVNAIQTTSGVEMYLAKAWVNFNGAGTVAIRASGNVTSITDNGVGDYTVNFTTAMLDTSYSLNGNSGNSGASALGIVQPYALSTSSARVQISNTSAALSDRDWVLISIFR